MSAPRDLAKFSDAELLRLRFCDLPVHIENTPLSARVARLHGELDRKRVGWKPHAWLSEEFFTPDGVGGIAIPFYLAHPRLVRLERRMMMEAEGATQQECLRILRHEAGHAIDEAYALTARPEYRAVFGPPEQPYPIAYQPQPNSRDYVLNLNAWYAQAHPVEDFAETFSVWLSPQSRWRQRYAGWPALKKLETVDRWMRDLADTPPVVTSRAVVEPIEETKRTLGEHYRAKTAFYSLDWVANFDRELQRFLASEKGHAHRPTALSVLRRFRRELREMVADGAGVHQYTVDQLIRLVMGRCRALGLRTRFSAGATKEHFLVLLTAQTMNVLHRGYNRIPL